MEPRNPPVLAKAAPELVIVAALLIVRAPSFSKAEVLRVELTIRRPAPVLNPPSQISGALLVRAPAFVKFWNDVEPFCFTKLSDRAVTPLNDELAAIR